MTLQHLSMVLPPQLHQHLIRPSSLTFMSLWPPNNTWECCMETHCPLLWYLQHHLVLHHLGFSQILDPQLSVMEPPLPHPTGSLTSLYYPHMEPQSPTLVLFPQCRCIQCKMAVFRASFPAVFWCKRPAATTTRPICQNVFLQIFYPVCKDLIPRILDILEPGPVMLCTFPFLIFQKTVTPCTDPQLSVDRTILVTKELCLHLF